MKAVFIFCPRTTRTVPRVIGKVRVDEPFQEAAGNTSRDPEVDGRTDQDCIRFLNLPKNRLEIIFHRTVPVTLPAIPLAGKAADTAFEIQVIQVIQFGLSPL